MTSAGAAVLRDDDPCAAALAAVGWTIAHRSWGARLLEPDLAGLAAIVDGARAQGYVLRELEPADDDAVVALDAANRGAYPGGPATAPATRTRASIADDRAAGTRWFGALRSGALVAGTAIRAGGDRAETDWTSVASAHRRRGLAEAVKAASVLAFAAEGVRVFGTGGADENTASLAMNRRLGYSVTERWVTLLPPQSSPIRSSAATPRA